MKRKFIAGQSARIMEAFRYPKTMLQVAHETGIERANICWEVHDCRENGSIYRLHRGICPISGARATFYTTNPKGWQTLVAHFSGTLKNLDDDLFLDACNAIKSYYLNHYDNITTIVPPGVREYWDKTLKPLIDAEVLK